MIEKKNSLIRYLLSLIMIKVCVISLSALSQEGPKLNRNKISELLLNDSEIKSYFPITQKDNEKKADAHCPVWSSETLKSKFSYEHDNAQNYMKEFRRYEKAVLKRLNDKKFSSCPFIVIQNNKPTYYIYNQEISTLPKNWQIKINRQVKFSPFDFEFNFQYLSYYSFYQQRISSQSTQTKLNKNFQRLNFLTLGLTTRIFRKDTYIYQLYFELPHPQFETGQENIPNSSETLLNTLADFHIKTRSRFLGVKWGIGLSYRSPPFFDSAVGTALKGKYLPLIGPAFMFHRPLSQAEGINTDWGLKFMFKTYSAVPNTSYWSLRYFYQIIFKKFAQSSYRYTLGLNINYEAATITDSTVSSNQLSTNQVNLGLGIGIFY